MPAHFKF